MRERRCAASTSLGLRRLPSAALADSAYVTSASATDCPKPLAPPLASSQQQHWHRQRQRQHYWPSSSFYFLWLTPQHGSGPCSVDVAVAAVVVAPLHTHTLTHYALSRLRRLLWFLCAWPRWSARLCSPPHYSLLLFSFSLKPARSFFCFALLLICFLFIPFAEGTFVLASSLQRTLGDIL